MVSSACLRLLIFLLAISIPACDSSSPVFHMMYSAYKLNKQGDNIQPWHTPFPVLIQSIVPCKFLTVASWLTYRFLRKYIRWSSIPICLKIFHGFCDPQTQRRLRSQWSRSGCFSGIPCFQYDPMNVDSLISGSSAFSELNLYIWEFLVQILLKPTLKDFEDNLTSMWNENNCLVVWTFFGTALLWIGMKTDIFQSRGHCWVFQICWHIEYSTLQASSFRIWNSSAGILSPPLALFVVMLPKAHLTSHSRMSGPRWVTTPSWLSKSLRPFLCSSYV